MKQAIRSWSLAMLKAAIPARQKWGGWLLNTYITLHKGLRGYIQN